MPDSTSQLRTVLSKYWGYDTFRPLQLETMQSVLAERDSLVVLPTGGGKSLCYQAPAMCLEGTAVIVSPLISLMKDQVDAARACGIPASLLNSSLNVSERREVMQDLKAGKIKLLYVAPERLTPEGLLCELSETKLSFIAIDEAHCVSQWGHDFRPHYRELHRLREGFPDVGMHAFTATATERVRHDVIQQLKLREPEVLIGSFDRPNLTYRAEGKSDVVSQIDDIIRRHEGESGIVYAITRKEVDRLAATLKHMGHKVKPYHAGLTDKERKDNQEKFIDDRVTTIVATVAFGMGIDKSDVRYVVHAGMPQSLEHYQQESGRAGRDGLEAECCLFFGGDDVLMWKHILGDKNDEQYKHAMDSLNKIAGYCRGSQCRHQLLVKHFGQELESDCGSACDICLDEREEVDESLTLGQKILSSVYRQQQRFGVEYTAQVLKGSREARIVQNGHESLSTWGLMKDETKPTIMDWIGQLVQQGFLEKVGEYNILKITSEGGRLLKGEVAPRLLRMRPKEALSRERRTRTQVDPHSWEGVDRELFEELRKLRTSKANEMGLPPYLVFGDAALRDMARRRPSTPEGFLKVSGVGKKKCDDFGDEFTAVIRAHCEAKGLKMDVTPSMTPSPVKSTPSAKKAGGPSAGALTAFPMFREGLSVADVSSRMARAESTVQGYLNQFLEGEKITDPSPWVHLPLVERIEKAIAIVGGEGALRPIFEQLDGSVSYDAIHVVVRCWRNRQVENIE